VKLKIISWIGILLTVDCKAISGDWRYWLFKASPPQSHLIENEVIRAETFKSCINPSMVRMPSPSVCTTSIKVTQRCLGYKTIIFYLIDSNYRAKYLEFFGRIIFRSNYIKSDACLRSLAITHLRIDNP